MHRALEHAYFSSLLLAVVFFGCEVKPAVYHKDKAVQQVLNSSVSDGLNIVFLGDGYIKDDLKIGGVYEAVGKESVEAIFQYHPFNIYKDYFNAYIVYAESADSGADLDDNDMETINTIFNSTFWYNDTERLLVAQDTELVRQYLEYAVNSYTDADIILISVNSQKYGGSGGYFSVFSRDERSIQIMMHELGHSFGGLADEYIDEAYSIYRPLDEVIYKPNVDTTDNLTTIKWKDFIGLPGYEAVNAFEGGYYRKTGVWRPEETSIMKTLLSYTYNAPSRYAIVKKIYSETGQTLTWETFLSLDDPSYVPVVPTASRALEMPVPVYAYLNKVYKDW